MYRIFLLMLSLIALVAASLPGNPAAAQAGDPNAPDDLIGVQWQLIAYGLPNAQTPTLAGSLVTLEFDRNGRASGSAGCNRFNGEYRLTGDKLTFGPMARTELACLNDALMRQEETYLSALQTTTAYRLSADRLILTYQDGNILTFARAHPLMETRWQLIAYGPADERKLVTTLLPITLALSRDGQATGYGGCNMFKTTYQVKDDRIAFGRIGATKMACRDAEAQRQESDYFAALQSATTFTIEGDRLVIAYQDGQLTGQLTFSRLSVLANTRWQLVSLGPANDPTDAQKPLVPGSVITLEFGADGRAGGSGGCNSYGTSYQTQGNAITFEKVVSTMMACMEGGIMEQEQAYFAALESAATFTLVGERGDQLIIDTAEGQRLTFTARKTE